MHTNTSYRHAIQTSLSGSINVQFSSNWYLETIYTNCSVCEYFPYIDLQIFETTFNLFALNSRLKCHIIKFALRLNKATD